jgi:hypothetical protein
MRGCAAILDPSQIDRLVPMATKDRRLAGKSRLRAAAAATSLGKSYRCVPRGTVMRSPMMVTSNSDKGTASFVR